MPTQTQQLPQNPPTTLVAIIQNASCGVRTWIACQLRLSTSTIVLFRMSVIKLLDTATAPRVKCLFFIEMAQVAATTGNAPALPVSETGVQTSTQRQNW